MYYENKHVFLLVFKKYKNTKIRNISELTLPAVSIFYLHTILHRAVKISNHVG